MAKRKKKEKQPKDQDQRIQEDKDSDKEIDPYTGEVEPPAEAAYQVTEITPKDPGNREGENYLLDEESPFDKTVLDADADDISRRITSYTDDEDIKEIFEERQDLATGGRRKLEEKLNEHNSMDPSLSADDIDAAWEDSVASGEESVGGSDPTPDQDVVDEIGEALGITFQDEEPLKDKLEERDRHRFELDPKSADKSEEDEDSE